MNIISINTRKDTVISSSSVGALASDLESV